MNAMWMVASLLATVVTYSAAKALHRRVRLAILSPMIVVPVVLIATLVALKADYAHYSVGAGLLSKLLGPAVVAFAIPIYRNLSLIRRNAPEILVGVAVGTVVAVVSSVALAVLTGLDPAVIRSIGPRSITTPIAMAISKGIGGTPAITATMVILTGLLGLAIGPTLLKMTRFKSPAARGVMLGMGAHACGTSQAMGLGSEEGTTASVTMTAAGIAGIIATPLLTAWLRHLA